MTFVPHTVFAHYDGKVVHRMVRNLSFMEIAAKDSFNMTIVKILSQNRDQKWSFYLTSTKSSAQHDCGSRFK